MSKIVHIGNGAGFSGDRFDAAQALVQHLKSCDGPRYLMFEVLAERTIASAQKAKAANPDAGFSPYLDHYVTDILGDIQQAGITLVSNMGAANPEAAARRIHELAAEQGLKPFKIAVLTGDDVREYLDDDALLAAETMEGTSLAGRTICSANVYLGGRHVAAALATGADIVLVGRTTDSALVLGPLIHEFGWAEDELDKLAAGTICGHLLECGGQVSGTYFADPGFKDVPDLAHVGFPVTEVTADGSFVITKPEGTGGLISPATVTEQLLYEMHDPSRYLVPDVTADVTQMTVTQDASNRIRVAGVKGSLPPETLKITVCVEGGWLAEAEMSYCGANGLARAELAGHVVKTRMAESGCNQEIRMDVFGAYSALDGGILTDERRASLRFDDDYRLRLSLVSETRATAQKLHDELQSLYCSGPAAGGGFRGSVTEQMSSASVLMPRAVIEPHVSVHDVPAG